jgi:hypothetical protein
MVERVNGEDMLRQLSIRRRKHESDDDHEALRQAKTP